jgi:hypothetical protein
MSLRLAETLTDFMARLQRHGRTGYRAPYADRAGGLTKTEDEETIIINRSGRSTYPEEKSVLRSGATRDVRIGQLPRPRHNTCGGSEAVSPLCDGLAWSREQGPGQRRGTAPRLRASTGSRVPGMRALVQLNEILDRCGPFFRVFAFRSVITARGASPTGAITPCIERQA